MTAPEERSIAEDRQGFFGRLPVFDPDPALWDRIRAGQLRNVRRRRRIRVGILGGASAFVLGLVVFGLPGKPGKPGVASELASRQVTSALLQSQLVFRADDQADLRARSDLRVIDTALQIAYDRNAGDDELKALWNLRNEVLRSLAAQGHPGQSLTRI